MGIVSLPFIDLEGTRRNLYLQLVLYVLPKKKTIASHIPIFHASIIIGILSYSFLAHIPPTALNR